MASKMDSKMNPISDKERVTIIGAGVIGLANAIALQQAGFKVTLVDKEGVAAGASSGNAGHFATEQVFPLADPAMLIKLPGMLLDPLGPFRIQPRYFHRALPWFMRFLHNMLPSKRWTNSQGIKALNQHSIAAWQALVKTCQCESLLTLNGSLLVFETTPYDVIQKTYDSYADAGVTVKLISGHDARLLEPDLSENVSYALYFTDVGHTEDPTALCEALANTFIERGGELLLETVNSVTSNDTAHIQVETAAGSQIITDKVLLCTGAWSKPLAKQLGFSVPLETERGYHLMMPQNSRLSRPVASFERKFIITPMAQGTRLAGTVEFGGLVAPLVAARADCLLPHAKALLPEVLASAKIEDGQRWMGFRPSMPDSLPVVGRSPKHANVFFSFGHQHLGLTWAAISAQLLTQQVTDVETDIAMHPYRIERFG